MRLTVKIPLILALVSVLPLCALGYYALVRVERTVTLSKNHDLLAMASQVGREIRRAAEEGAGSIRLLAENPAVASPEADKELKRLELEKTQRYHPLFKDITLLDREGRVVASVFYSFHGSFAATSWFKNAIEGKSAVTGANTLLYPLRYVITYAEPVIPPGADAPQGALIGQLDMEPIFRILADVDRDMDCRALLVDGRGVVIGAAQAQELMEPLPVERVREQVASGRGSVVNAPWLGRPSVSAYSPLAVQGKGENDLGWGVLLVQSEDVAYAGVRKAREGLLLAASVCLGAALAFSGLLLKGARRKTKLLLAAARRLGEGDFSTRIPNLGSDEFGELARAFDLAGERLEQSYAALAAYHGDLERLVGARTEELSRANKELRRQVHLREKTEKSLRRAKEEAEAANMAKTEFLAGMSHEIRTPMNAILGMAEILSDGELDPERREHVRVLKGAGQSLLTIIDDILDISKVEAGQLRLDVVPFDVVETVSSVCALMRYKAVGKGLTFSRELPGKGSPRLVGDPVRLRQILVNLVGNAVKFTERGGVSVRLEFREDDGGGDGLVEVRLAVSDTGVGIPPDKLDWIFDRFSQVDSSSTRRYGGVGLGLSICKSLAELMGGRIAVESEPGRGSVFTFTARLPRAPGDSPALSQEAGPTPPGGPSPEAALPPLRILLMEDNPSNRTLTAVFLKNAPFVLRMAENGQEGVEAFATEPFDLALVDLEMPVMGGVEAVLRIREMERERGLPRTPVLALTANALDSQLAGLLEAGFDERLTKPIGKARLLEAILRHAGSAGPSSFAAPSVSAPGPGRAGEDQVRVEASLKPLLPTFLETTREGLERMRQAAAAGDAATLAREGHSLKGAAGGYGFDRAGELGARLQEAAERGDLEEGRRLVDALAGHLERLRVVFV